MGKAFERPTIYRVVRDEIHLHKALSRASVDMARDLLRREPPPDTFLGRQHYELIPLPYEEE